MAQTRIPSSGLGSDLTLTGTTYFAGNILPTSNNTVNIGSPDARFGTLYLTANTIDLGGAQISTTESGSISFTTATGNIDLNANTVNFLSTVSEGTAGQTGYTGSRGTDGIIGVDGYTGSQGDTGLGFAIAKSYASVAALEADTAPTGIAAGQFAIIETGSVDDVDNSKLYLWSGTAYSYVTDLSGAAGITGSIGFTGSRGTTGFVGSVGAVGYTGSAGTGGGTVSVWQLITSNYSLTESDRLLLNSSAGSFTLTLPPMPALGAYIQLIDAANLFANPVYVDPNGATIEGSSNQLALDVSDSSIELVYDGVTWQVTSTYGPRGPLGYAGSAGTNGYTGSLGYAGSAGTNGYTGSMGFVGSTGAGYTGSASTAIGYTGSAGLNDWQVVTSSYSPLNKDRILVNTSAGAFTLTLPTTPATGYYFMVSDAADLSINSVVVDPNGATIEGSTNQLALDVSNATFEFIYDGTTWQVTSTIGPKGDRGYTGSVGSGYTGSQGISGYNGSTGFTGSSGSDGYTGSTGSGYVGSRGNTGFVGSAGLKDWTQVTSNYTAAERDRLLLDASSGVFTLTLPQNPTVGAYIQLSDAADLSINSVVVDPNGATIEGSTNQLALDVSNATFEFIYDGTTWQVTSTIGPKGDRGYTGSSGFRTWAIVSANITANAGDNLFVDTSVSSVQVTLPTVAALGDQVTIVDAEANAATNNIVINRNGHAINGLTQNLVIDTNASAVVLAYYSTARGWISVNK